MQVNEMTDEHLESYKVMLIEMRKNAKEKLDEIFIEQMRRCNEKKGGD